MALTDTADAIETVLKGAVAGALEGDRLDFKEPAADTKSTLRILADAAVCFANALGGDIVLGVSDVSAGEEAFVGVSENLSVDVIRKAIFDRSRPPLTCFVEDRNVAGRRVVVISVPPGVAPHANASGTATRRLGRECLPFTPEQQREVLMARGQLDFSAEPCGATTHDLSAAEFDRMRRLLRLAGREELAALPDMRLLEALRLARPEDERITNAGLILLGSESALAEHLPSYGYSYQFRPSTGSEASARMRERRPLLAAVESVIDAIAARVQMHPLNLAGGVQLRLSDYPLSTPSESLLSTASSTGRTRPMGRSTSSTRPIS